MSKTTATPETPVASTLVGVNPYTAIAQGLIDQFRALRDQIPRLIFAPSKPISRKLIANASVPDAFVEMASVNITNTQQLAAGSGAVATELRDQMLYAIAFNVLADELEAIAGAARHTVTDARHKAGTDALNVYAIAKRLAATPGFADLIPVVEAMQHLLGRTQPRPRKKASPAPTTPGSATQPTAESPQTIPPPTAVKPS